MEYISFAAVPFPFLSPTSILHGSKSHTKTFAESKQRFSRLPYHPLHPFVLFAMPLVIQLTYRLPNQMNDGRYGRRESLILFVRKTASITGCSILKTQEPDHKKAPIQKGTSKIHCATGVQET